MLDAEEFARLEMEAIAAETLQGAPRGQKRTGRRACHQTWASFRPLLALDPPSVRLVVRSQGWDLFPGTWRHDDASLAWLFGSDVTASGRPRANRSRWAHLDGRGPHRHLGHRPGRLARCQSRRSMARTERPVAWPKTAPGLRREAAVAVRLVWALPKC